MSSYTLPSQAQLDYGIESNLKKITGKGYNEKGNLDQTRNFAEFTVAPVLTSTITTQYGAGQPPIASSNTSFDYLTKNRPVSSSNSPVIKTVITTTGQGIEIDFSDSPLSLDQGDVIGIPVKVSSLTPTFNIVFEGTTSTDTLTLSAVNLASYGFEINTWGNLKLKLSQFTATTNFTYGDIKKLKITGTGACDLYTQQIQTANNLFCLVGAELSIVFNCPKELEEDIDRSVEMVKCQNNNKDSRATNMEATVSFKALGMSLAHEGYAMGTSVKGGIKKVTRVINGDKGLKKLKVTAGEVVTGITVDPKSTIVIIDGAPLQRVDAADLVDDTSYHVTETGTFKVGTAHNNKEPYIEDKVNKYVSYITDKGIIDSFAFQITSSREIEGQLTAETLFKKVKFNSIKGSQEDAYIDSEVEMSVLIKDGDYKEKYLH